ncbi:MAG: SpoIVB peptidase [Eubacteriales bacterium]|nr:SpoIVB peptidase [Eubacteriales bacterium]
MKNKIKRIAAMMAVIIIIFVISPAAEGADCAPVWLDIGASVNIKELKLSPGGMAFGVKFHTDGVMVVGFCDIETETGKVNPAYAAGVRLKDVITAVNGISLSGSSQLTQLIEESAGQPVTLTCRRDGRELNFTLSPVFSRSENRYKTGVWVRDSGAGIGTVTFIVPETGAFAGLGHGICDSETGELIPMQRGYVTGVTVSGLTRGIAGNPGEIKGYFSSGKCGTLIGNTDNGVYGIFTQLPAEPPESALPVATRSEVRAGSAYIWCTLDTNQPCRYSVELSCIDTNSTSNKCFTVTVTDPALLEKTGGIIQGMSGSPIIQDGKIVGAVTHVLINDPSRGYGIFVENMLDSMPDLLR